MRSSHLQRVAHDDTHRAGVVGPVCEPLAYLPHPRLGGTLGVRCANRACPDSCPGRKRLALQAASESAARLKSATSVTVALPGMVAHSVTALASASVHTAAADAASVAAVPAGGGRARRAGQQRRPHAATVAVITTPSRRSGAVRRSRSRHVRCRA